MERVAIVGCAGAGKSTLARALGARTGLPVVHLDAHFWTPGWVETPRDRWGARVDALIAGNRWILDGNYGGTMERRFARADTIVFLDVPRWRCLGRVVRRRWQYAGRTRPDMTAGCRERLHRTFLAYVWGYERSRRPTVLDRIRRFADGRRVEILRANRDVARFLESA